MTHLLIGRYLCIASLSKGVMRSTPPSNDHAHEHEWRPVEDSFPMYEDGAAIFHYRCKYVERTGESYSAKHDETFYDIGYECDEHKTVRYDIEEIRFTPSDHQSDVWMMTPEEVRTESETLSTLPEDFPSLSEVCEMLYDEEMERKFMMNMKVDVSVERQFEYELTDEITVVFRRDTVDVPDVHYL